MLERFLGQKRDKLGSNYQPPPMLKKTKVIKAGKPWCASEMQTASEEHRWLDPCDHGIA